jgi:serine/threonine-protein kinase HipA
MTIYSLTIGIHWKKVCDEGDLSEIDRWGRQFLNPFVFDDLKGKRAFLKELARQLRKRIS